MPVSTGITRSSENASGQEEKQWELRLYVAGQTPNSLRDCLNIRQKGQSRAYYPDDQITNSIPD